MEAHTKNSLLTMFLIMFIVFFGNVSIGSYHKEQSIFNFILVILWGCLIGWNIRTVNIFKE